jgi:hypothetical protein
MADQDQTTWLASWFPPTLLLLCQTAAELVSLITWGLLLLLCFVEFYLFHNITDFIKLINLMFWTSLLCLLLVFCKLLDPSRCFTLEINSEMCGYDQDYYFQGKFLTPPNHRRLWRWQISCVLNEAQRFHMTDWRNRISVWCFVKQWSGGAASPDIIVEGAANWATKLTF